MSGKYFLEYMCALKNELSVDEYMYSLENKTAKQYGYMPRPQKWILKFKDKPLLVCFIAFLLKILFVIGGFVIHFRELIRMLFLKLNAQSIESANDDVVYALGFSERAYDVIPTVVKKNIVWIDFPWVDRPVTQGESVDFIDLVSFRDLFEAFLYASMAPYSLVLRKQFNTTVLQTYTAFRWYLTHIVLSKVDCQGVVIAEHFDRWAVLTDSVVAEKRKSCCPHMSFHIVQHGSLGIQNTKTVEHSFNFKIDIPCRLKNVTSLYVYDDFSKDVFFDSILSLESIGDIEVFYFKPSIQLVKVKIDKSLPVVLIVGHPICFNYQLMIYDNIKDYAVVYYKPHPTVKAPAEIKSREWMVIDEKNFFPVVDCVISYPSTLVEEYSLHAVKCVVHPINAGPDEAFATSSLILNFLSKVK